MASIVTVTFNPALDKSLSIPALVPDKKIKCSVPVCEPGGGGINVARAIKKLGANAVAVYLAGGDTGKKITRLLKEDSIESIAIEIGESSRENLIVQDVSTKKQYLFDMPGPEVTKQEWQKCLDIIDELLDVKYIVASGSLPPGVPDDVFAQLSSIAKRKNARLIVDTSGEGLKRAVQSGVYLIKPNIRELSRLVGKEELNLDSATGAAKTLIDKGKCEAVVVSLGPLGAMLVTKDLAIQVAPPELQIKSTVGAGDSMVAGIVLGLLESKTLLEAVQFGVACGTAATLNPGTELCIKEDAENLYKIIRKQAGMIPV
jgi:6-phosphofructokinase 2